MYQVIARKYRPQSFAELISQEHVRGTLENAINHNRIAHGYIFSGQRGTGKTTVARIMARCLNCEQGPTTTPCGVCASCSEITGGAAVDVIEIDAASNRGINEMRELRENVRYRPARGRYKVFIVDEAHQITSEAFNALLKTLEEPPEWVVFILCTTESHKIPTTIASRCQQFSFRSVDFAELVTRMRWICEQEGIAADEEALSVLAQAGEGSVRDSLSALDQAIACCGDKLHAQEVRELLGMFSLGSLDRVAEALVAGDAKQMLDVVAELEANGRSLQHFARELARYIRNLLVAKIAGAGSRLIAASPAEQEGMAAIAAKFNEDDLTRHLKLTLDLFRDLQSSLQPRLHLEMGLIRLVQAGRLKPIEEALASLGSSSAPAPPANPTPAPTRSAPPSYSSAPSSGSAAPPWENKPAASFEKPAPRAAAPKPEPAAAKPEPAPVLSGDLQTRLHQILTDTKQTFLADAIAHCTLEESATELVFAGPRLYKMNIGSPALAAAVKQALGKPIKITFKEGAASEKQPVAQTAGPSAGDTEVRDRALSHPEVQRFQEMFPDSQVRTVRNLKE